MTIQKLIEELQKCNPDARVVISKSFAYSDYTWGTEDKDVTGLLAWPDPKETAPMIEITHEG